MADMPRKLTKKRPALGAHLMNLRQAAGLSQIELSEILGVNQQTIAFWEQSAKPPRSTVLPEMAKALGVKVEELLSCRKGRARLKAGPVGKLQKTFEAVSKLPRRQQEKIIDIIELFLHQQK
jgi:transcriptional regulator with XRE-family HTH domain